MGMYTICCPTCGTAHYWFSGNIDQRCPTCQKEGRIDVLSRAALDKIRSDQLLVDKVGTTIQQVQVTPPPLREKRRLYRKKPVPVCAVRWFKLGDEPPATIVEVSPGCESVPPCCFRLSTLEGWQDITPGAWIVGPGHRGEYWVVQNDIFEATYEEYP